MKRYKSPGVVIGIGLGERIAVPMYPGDTSTVPGDGPPFYATVKLDRGYRGGEIVIPVGLQPPELGDRVMITIEEVE